MRKVTIVRQHTRSGRVVRSHSRKLQSAILDVKKKYKIKTPIEAEIIDESKGSSLGHTDSVLDSKTKKPVKHIVRLESSKIKKEGENIDSIIHHELGHIVDKEKGDMVKKPKGKAVIAAIKKTEAYKKIKGDKYAAKPAEMFARAYAQDRSGKTSKKEVQSGLAWERKDFKSVKAKMKNV